MYSLPVSWSSVEAGRSGGCHYHYGQRQRWQGQPAGVSSLVDAAGPDDRSRLHPHGLTRLNAGTVDYIVGMLLFLLQSAAARSPYGAFV